MLIIGKIIKNHGVKGLVKIKSFLSNPEDLKKYRQFFIDEIINIKLKFIGKSKDYYICQINKISNAEDTNPFLNKNIYVHEKDLPKLKKGEYYYYELEGLNVRIKQKIQGKVNSIHNHGAGDYLEIEMKNKQEVLVPYNEFHILKINVKRKYLDLNPLYYKNDI